MVRTKSIIKEALKQNRPIFYTIKLTKKLTAKLKHALFSDKFLIERHYKRVFNRSIDLANPKTLNEKIQWLKLYDRKEIYTTLADKYAVREWLAKRFGEQYLILLLFTTTNWREITPENIPDVPCIIKANHSAGTNFICRDKSSINWHLLQNYCMGWLMSNHYDSSQEWQYKNIPPRIIVEKLLLTHEGKLPNDYKLEFFNGKLEFIYCSIDREGENFRKICSKNWETLPFTWGRHINKSEFEIEPPASFPEMLEIGSKIARLFRYVRVDFYDVDGKLYYGEITLHHGSGYDKFNPESYDLLYRQKLDLNAPVEEDVQ